MTRIAFAVGCLTALLFSPNAISQLETPQASPLGKIEQTVGIMKVSVEYSRPGIKGRKIFGGLVPFDEVWRTGANSPTKITFSDDVKLEGSPVPAGTYSLYTIPGKEEWTIIINKKIDGGEVPDEEEDILRFSVKPTTLQHTVETFTINVNELRDDTASLELMWENTLVKFGLQFDLDAKVMAQISEVMADPYSELSGTYFQAATYYYNHGKDLTQALEWVDEAVKLNPDAFFMWRLKSQIHAGLEDYEGAIDAARIGIEKAEKAGSKQFVKYNQDAIAEWERKR